MPGDIKPEIIYFTDTLALIEAENSISVKFYDYHDILLDRAVFVGEFTDSEMPYADKKQFEENLIAALSDKRINAIKIIDRQNFRLEPHAVSYRAYPVTEQFIAQLYIRPRYYLGLKFEPRNLIEGEYIVRGFYEANASDYLRTGDKIIAINGVDVLEHSNLIREWFRWKVGDQVSLEIQRGGKSIEVKVPVFPNP